MTAGLGYFLLITHEGMASVELFTGQDSVHILSNLEVDQMILQRNIIGRRDEDVEIKGEDVSMQETNDQSSLTSKFPIFEILSL